MYSRIANMDLATGIDCYAGSRWGFLILTPGTSHACLVLSFLCPGLRLYGDRQAQPPESRCRRRCQETAEKVGLPPGVIQPIHTGPIGPEPAISPIPGQGGRLIIDSLGRAVRVCGNTAALR
jgi:hypothetical protein